MKDEVIIHGFMFCPATWWDEKLIGGYPDTRRVAFKPLIHVDNWGVDNWGDKEWRIEMVDKDIRDDDLRFTLWATEMLTRYGLVK